MYICIPTKIISKINYQYISKHTKNTKYRLTRTERKNNCNGNLKPLRTHTDKDKHISNIKE